MSTPRLKHEIKYFPNNVHRHTSQSACLSGSSSKIWNQNLFYLRKLWLQRINRTKPVLLAYRFIKVLCYKFIPHELLGLPVMKTLIFFFFSNEKRFIFSASKTYKLQIKLCCCNLHCSIKNWQKQFAKSFLALIIASL